MALWSVKILGMISNFFEFIKARFMAQDVISPGEGCICTSEKGEMLPRLNLHLLNFFFYHDCNPNSLSQMIPDMHTLYSAESLDT